MSEALAELGADNEFGAVCEKGEGKLTPPTSSMSLQ